MKILLVNTFYYPNMIGGTEHSVKILAEGLKKSGNEVAVYSFDNKSSDLKKETINDVIVYRGRAGKYNIDYWNGKNNIFKLKNKIIEINNITAIKEIRNVIEDFRPDIIHTNNLFGISNIIWKIAKEEYNIPIVHTLRDYWMLYPIVSNEKLSKILFQPFMKKRTKYVDVVTAPSNCTLNKFINVGYFKKSKKQCVYNAININVDETKNYLTKKEEKKDNNIKFMYVGMLTQNKGIKNLLNVFSNIDNKEISLHIYGQGELKNIIEDYVKSDNRIKYYGQLSTEDLKKEWIKNDVLIVPSIWEEPFGRVVIEGNQYGLPVIGSNRGGIKEIIDNIKTGELFTYNNLEELKEKIIYFTDRKNIKKYYPNIIKNIDVYSVEKQVETFLNIYKEGIMIRRS